MSDCQNPYSSVGMLQSQAGLSESLLISRNVAKPSRTIRILSSSLGMLQGQAGLSESLLICRDIAKPSRTIRILSLSA